MMSLCYNIITIFMSSLPFDVITLHYDIIVLKCLYLKFQWHYVVMSLLYDVMFHYDLLHYIIM